MARRTILLSEVNLTEESVNLSVSGTLAVTGAATFSGQILAADGTVSAPGYALSTEATTGFYKVGAGVVGMSLTGTLAHQFGSTYHWITSDSGVLQIGASADINLVRDAADVLAMKNLTAAQTLRIYGDATAATLKYLTLTHDGTNGLITTSGGTFGFGTHTTSAGTNINGVTGYISIVDSGGTPRRLAVLT